MKGQRSRSYGSFEFLLCLLWSSVHISPIHFTWDTPITHEISIKPRNISRSKFQRSRSRRSFEVFVISAPWLNPYLTQSLHMWDIYNTCMWCAEHHLQVKVTRVVTHFGSISFVVSSLFDWITSYVAHIQHMRDEVSHTISSMEGQRPRSQASFKVLNLSTPWLPAYCLVKWFGYVGIWRLRHAAAIKTLDLLVFLYDNFNNNIHTLEIFVGFPHSHTEKYRCPFTPKLLAVICFWIITKLLCILFDVP